MQHMRSRLLIGASAWLLGALTATGGSMLAVSHLAHGLLGPDTQQLSPAVVRDDLAGYQRPGAAPTGTAAAGPAAAHARPARRRASAAPATSSAAPTGALLVSGAGSAMASCQSGLAYLQYWSPDQGYQADDVLRGPARQASLVFEGGTSGIRMRVSCQGPVPVAQLSRVSNDDGHTGGDE
jgi:hypothetical protein